MSFKLEIKDNQYKNTIKKVVRDGKRAIKEFLALAISISSGKTEAISSTISIKWSLKAFTMEDIRILH